MKKAHEECFTVRSGADIDVICRHAISQIRGTDYLHAPDTYPEIRITVRAEVVEDEKP